MRGIREALATDRFEEHVAAPLPASLPERIEMNVSPLLQAAPSRPGWPTGCSRWPLTSSSSSSSTSCCSRRCASSRRRRARCSPQLKKGDRVLTSGGIYGTIAQIEDQVVWVKIADTVKVKMARSAITSVVNETEAAKDASG